MPLTRIQAALTAALTELSLLTQDPPFYWAGSVVADLANAAARSPISLNTVHKTSDHLAAADAIEELGRGRGRRDAEFRS